MKNITKNVLATLLISTTAFAISSAQDTTTKAVVSTTVQASGTRPMMREGGMMDKMKDLKKDLKEEIKSERKDLRMNTKAMMKNATSSEDRRNIIGDAKDKREAMRASNTEDRKELKASSRDMAKKKMEEIVKKLDAVENRLQIELSKLIAYVTAKSSTTPPSVTKAIASGAAAASAVASLQLYASTTVTVENKDNIKSLIKIAKDTIKTFQIDLKAALETMKIDRSM